MEIVLESLNPNSARPIFLIMSWLKSKIEEEYYTNAPLTDYLYKAISTMPGRPCDEEDIEDCMDHAEIFFPEAFVELLETCIHYGVIGETTTFVIYAINITETNKNQVRYLNSMISPKISNGSVTFTLQPFNFDHGIGAERWVGKYPHPKQLPEEVCYDSRQNS